MQTSFNNLQKDQVILTLSSDLKQKSLLKLASNIMLREMLSSTFKKNFWKQISNIKPQIFIAQQKEIFNLLMSKQEDFEMYFMKFYSNHTQLYHWYVLASQKHEQMKKYVFFKILNKSIKQYRCEMKSIVSKRKNIKIQAQKLDISKFCLRSTPDSPKKNDILKNKNSSSHVNLQKNNKNRNLSQNLVQQKNQDYHQLFMNTLDACSGYKYIHYNFIKHQQGYQTRGKYNNFIRIKKKQTLIKDSNNELNMYKTFNTPFIPNPYDQNDSYPQNIVSLYESFYDTPKTSQEPNRKNKRGNKQNKLNYNAFILTPIGSAAKIQKIKNKWQIDRKNLVIKKLPNRFGKIKIKQAEFSQALLRELEMPLLI